jgi:hypothetical protein
MLPQHGGQPNYLRFYEDSSFEELRMLNYRKLQSKLDKCHAKVEASFKEHTPSGVKESSERIK